MRRKLLNGKMMGMLAVILALFMAVGVAEEERTDASGQWKYVLEDGGATIRDIIKLERVNIVSKRMQSKQKG